MEWLNILSLALTFLSLGAAYYFYQRTKNEGTLVFTVSSSEYYDDAGLEWPRPKHPREEFWYRQTIARHGPLYSRLKDGRYLPVNHIFKRTVTLELTGNRTIEAKDIRQPLTIAVRSSAEPDKTDGVSLAITKASIESIQGGDIGEPTVSLSGGEITLGWTYLDPGTSMVLSIEGEGRLVNVDIRGRFAGVHLAKRIRRHFDWLGTPTALLVAALWALGTAMLTIFAESLLLDMFARLISSEQLARITLRSAGVLIGSVTTGVLIGLIGVAWAKTGWAIVSKLFRYRLERIEK